MSLERPTVVLAYPKIDHEKDYTYFWMPFSLLTIAKGLVDEGQVDVVIFDGNQRSAQEWVNLLLECENRIIFIGFSIMTGGGQIGHALDLARVARSIVGNTPLVFGGPHVNVLPEQTASHELVDIAMMGPGQESVPCLVQALQGQLKLRDVPGLIMKNSSRSFLHGPENPPRTGMLGQYPWCLLDVETYIRNDPTVASRTLNYVSSQGCVYKCRFCYEQVYKRKWSSQSADLMVDDIRSLTEQFKLNGIKFYDADWFINLKRAEEVCRAISNFSSPIRWAASINPKDVLKARKLRPSLLESVAISGCARLLMGVESGSDRVLHEIVDKEITRDEILSVANEISQHGIMGSYTFIVGFPGETEAETDETYALLDELRALPTRPETRVHLFAPYPGTPLFEEALQRGFTPPTSLEEWSKFDYYENQTPWTSIDTAKKARTNTHMIRPP